MMRYRKFFDLVIIVPLIAIMYSSTFVWLYERYIAADSYYSHGFLVPIVSIFLSWIKRKELVDKSEVKFSLIGIILVFLSLLINILSVWSEVFFVSGFSLITLLFGISLCLYGRKVTKILIFPLSFLLFMIPLPLIIVNAISFPLKMIVTNGAVGILKTLLNIPIRNDGFQIFFPHTTLIVENPCSGLRSLISMLALGSIFGYLLKANNTKRIGLFLLSIPIALLTNLMRVILLSIAVYVYGDKLAKGFFHDLTGYIAFVMSFICLWFFWRKFECRR